jgi:uncharacterized protein
MEFVLVALIVFLGSLTQSMIGFGGALVCMPLLLRVLAPTSAGALYALFSLPLQLIIMWRYRHALDIRPLWRLAVGSLVGIPIGVLLVERLDERIILSALGIFLIAYALYSLYSPRLPIIRRARWDFGFGFSAGLLTGAYNTGGPPLVIYGASHNWTPEQFKGNLQVLFTLSDVVVIIAHLVAGHVDVLVMQHLLISLPVLAAASALGFALSHRVNEAVFRKLVLIFILLVGVRLLFP